MAKQAPTKTLAGVIGYFDEPGELLEATAEARKAKHVIDAFTPYPIHGLEHAQGLPRSFLPWVTFGAGITGFVCAFTLEYWTSAVSWPIIVGGKPMNSWPAFVPVMFELTVLFAGLFTVGAMLIANGLPNMKRKSFDPSITCDRFALLIESPTEKAAASYAKRGYKKFAEDDAASFLKKLGAKDVKTVYSEGWF